MLRVWRRRPVDSSGMGGAAMRPEFIRLVPAEVDQYGPHGAILAAHIRFRTQTENHARHLDDQDQWVWAASLAQLAHETGLSVRGVRTGLGHLGNAVVATKDERGSKQRHNYRMAAEETSADLPVGENDTVADNSVGGNDKPPCRKRQARVSKTTSALPIREPEPGGERARGQTADPASFSAWETPPAESSTEEQQHAPPGGGSVCLEKGQWPDWVPWPDWFPKPPQLCPHGGSCTGSCHHCGAQRKWHTTEAKERRQDLNYRHAWKRYNELLREAGEAGTLDYWRPERPPLNRTNFDPDRPWYVAGPPAEAAVA